jgi:hypothetical protein
MHRYFLIGGIHAYSVYMKRKRGQKILFDYFVPFVFHFNDPG